MQALLSSAAPGAAAHGLSRRPNQVVAAAQQQQQRWRQRRRPHGTGTSPLALARPASAIPAQNQQFLRLKGLTCTIARAALDSSPQPAGAVQDELPAGTVSSNSTGSSPDAPLQQQQQQQQQHHQQQTPPAAAAAVVVASQDDALDGIQLAQQRTVTGLCVRVRGMVKHFSTPKGVFRAVDGVDVDVPPASICALLGPSGSGKTTLLRLIAGLEQPTGGRIYFDDLDATDLAVQDRQVGMVFQSYALFNHMTVADNIKFGLQVRRLAVDHDKRAADLLELVQLSGLGERFPRQLSGGQRQRVALARALASNPRLLLLDEPFGALDAVVRKTLRAGLKEIVRSVGVTTIIVTHDQEEAFDLADRVVIFNRGIIEQAGAPGDIIRAPATPFVMNFVGDTNSVPAGCQLVRRSGHMPGSKARVMFRPGDMRVRTVFSDAPMPGGGSLTPATVAERASLGWAVRYVLRFDDDVEVEYETTLAAEAAADAAGETVSSGVLAGRLDVGQRVYVHVPPGGMMAFDPAEVDSAPVVS